MIPATFTVVCVYNRPEVLGRVLMASVEKQTVRADVRLVDNTGGRYSSAAEALNAGAEGASGKYLVFVHQDVDLERADFLERAGAMLDAIPDLGIAGMVGMSDGEPRREGRWRNRVLLGEGAGAPELGGPPLSEPAPVQTLDELLLIIPTAVFSELKFDPEACPHWDLYGVDYCLSARRRGLGAYALPLLVRHVSSGVLGSRYYASLGRVLRKHRGGVKRVYTTVEDWSTRSPLWWQRLAHNARTARNVAMRLFLRR
jgi:GT2 family glycosyltransferase